MYSFFSLKVLYAKKRDIQSPPKVLEQKGQILCFCNTLTNVPTRRDVDRMAIVSFKFLWKNGLCCSFHRCILLQKYLHIEKRLSMFCIGFVIWIVITTLLKQQIEWWPKNFADSTVHLLTSNSIVFCVQQK